MTEIDVPRRRLHPMFWWGVALLVVGTGPLLAIILAASLGLTADPDPNPIGPGLLTFFTFWPAVALIAAASRAAVSAFQRKDRKGS